MRCTNSTRSPYPDGCFIIIFRLDFIPQRHHCWDKRNQWTVVCMSTRISFGSHIISDWDGFSKLSLLRSYFPFR